MKRNLSKILGIIVCLTVVAAFCVAGLPSVSGSEPTGPTVKNVILLIGDGMGPAHVELTRLCLGGAQLTMEEMDETGPSYMTTYCLDRETQTIHEITDSAAAGSAIATGYKTFRGAVSVDFDGNPLETVRERAEAVGKATGIVTDVYIQDATPAVFLVHAERRGDTMAFSVAMVESDVDVLMGAGRGFFLPKGKGSKGGQRTDGRNLIKEWEKSGGTYVGSAEELEDAEINLAEGDKLLGLFGGLYNMDYDLDRQQDKKTQVPTLAQMTRKAIEILSQDEDGFFLMVEGGSIDWVSHDRDVAGMVAEMRGFDEAVRVALDFAKENGETLVVVTADHECGGLQMTSDSVKEEPPTFVPISEDLNVDFIRGITATVAYMWGKIRAGADMVGTVSYYTGYALSPAEVALIEGAGKNGQVLISDILSAEANVVWGYQGTDEGEHSFAAVPIYAYGPNADRFDVVTDNTQLGQELFIAVSGYWH